ncbi:peptidylprolyl isomerase [Candidatus Pacearchaeota archaeon]|nr:peptidylprolyl isomerase [Candidatus Pacearchaeota archaeon]
MEKIQKKDFIELEFIGKTKEGEVFDTNISEEAKKIGLEIENKPFIVCIGQKMVLQGLDNALEDKEVNKKYSVELQPKEAFGERNSSLIKLMPIKLFKEKQMNVYPGLTLSFDNTIAKVISVSGGRVLVDFNNPVAGKIVIYEFTIKRKVEDINEKINAITDYFLRNKFEFEIRNEDKKIIIKCEKAYESLIQMLNNQFKDILDLEMVIKEKKEGNNESKEESKVEN